MYVCEVRIWCCFNYKSLAVFVFNFILLLPTPALITCLPVLAHEMRQTTSWKRRKKTKTNEWLSNCTCCLCLDFDIRQQEREGEGGNVNCNWHCCIIKRRRRPDEGKRRRRRRRWGLSGLAATAFLWLKANWGQLFLEASTHPFTWYSHTNACRIT